MGTNNIGFTSKQIQELTQVVTTVFAEKTKPMKRDLRKIKSDLRIIINHFDNSNLTLVNNLSNP